jgi:hypothetical protein
MSRIIIFMPVKNDSWFVEKSITSALMWADHVIVADGSSNDGSHDIYKEIEKKYNNITIIYNRPKMDYTSSDLRNYGLNLCRNFDGNNIIIELHADEIVSGEILTREIKQTLEERIKVGDSFMMPWINIWKHPFYFRNDNSIWSNNKGWFGFRDDRISSFNEASFHGARAPNSLIKNKVEINFLNVLHFQFMNLGMERSKQALYQIFERNHYPNKNIESINKAYACAFDNRNLKLNALDPKHYKPWLDLKIQIDQKYPDEIFNWRDLVVLKNFKENGINKYKNLNIWYIDWEKKRKIAIQDFPNEIYPENPINDPRSLSTKASHVFLMKYQIYPFWRLDFFKLIINKLIKKIF